MKRLRPFLILLCLAVLLPGAGRAQQLSIERTLTPAQAVPDRGFYVSSFTWANAGLVGITDVNVRLSLTGGMRLGQMYATLTHGTAAESERVAVLLNRPGVTDSNAFGSNLGNLNVWFDDSGSDPNVFAIANATGTYKADGRINVDPYGPREAYDATDITAGLGALNGTWLNSGTWSLLVADAQSGKTATLDSWTLRVLGTAASSGVVDPGNGAVISVAGAGTQTFGASVASAGAGANAVRLDPGAGSQLAFGGGLSGAGEFRQQGDGVVRLAGVSSDFTGAFVVEAGELQLASSGALGASGRLQIAGSNSLVRLTDAAVIISNAVTLDAGAVARLDGAGTLAGVISGEGSLRKEGIGRLVISGHNSYTGGTTVQGGELSLAGGRLATSSTVTLGAGSTMSGYGTVGTVGGAGTFAPGNSPGITTVTQIDPSGGLDFDFEFTGAAPVFNNPAASINDLIRITGATPFSQSLGAENIINVYFSGDALFTGGSPKIVTGGFFTDAAGDFLSSVSGANFNYFFAYQGVNSPTLYNGINYGTLQQYQEVLDSDITITLSFIGQSANYDGLDINGQILQYEIIPEPSTYTLLVLASLALVAHRWRHRTRGQRR